MRNDYTQVVSEELAKTDGLYIVKPVLNHTLIDTISIKDMKFEFGSEYDIKLVMKSNGTYVISYEGIMRLGNMWANGNSVPHNIRLSAVEFHKFREWINTDETLDFMTKAIIVAQADNTKDKMIKFAEVVVAQWHYINILK